MTGNPKILITGSNGMLGSNLLEELTFKNINGFCSQELDITNRKQVFDVLNRIKPTIIIHTAAFTDVEACEINPDKCFKVNTIGTQNLVDFCVLKKILFVYISSTGVYGNNEDDKPHSEFNLIQPNSIHHKSKVFGEEIVKNHLERFLIIRTGWLYGGNHLNNKNFVYKRYVEGLNSSIIFSDQSQKGSPTYIKNLSNQIEILIKENINGIFNCVDVSNGVSRYEYVKEIIKQFNLNTKVEVAPKGMFKRVAPVSKNESAINYKLDLLGMNQMKDWKFALKEYIGNIKNEI